MIRHFFFLREIWGELFLEGIRRVQDCPSGDSLVHFSSIMESLCNKGKMEIALVLGLRATNNKFDMEKRMKHFYLEIEFTSSDSLYFHD